MNKDELALAMRITAVRQIFLPIAVRISNEYNARKAGLGLCSVLSEAAIGSTHSIAAYRRKLAQLRDIAATHKKEFETFLIELTRQILTALDQLPPHVVKRETELLQSDLQQRMNEMALYFDSTERWINAASAFFDTIEPHCNSIVFEPGRTVFADSDLLAQCRPLLSEIQKAHTDQAALVQLRLQRLAKERELLM
jgi:hypothetical protein